MNYRKLAVKPRQIALFAPLLQLADLLCPQVKTIAGEGGARMRTAIMTIFGSVIGTFLGASWRLAAAHHMTVWQFWKLVF